MKKSNRYLNLLVFIIFIIVVTLVYSNHFDNPFAFDDSHTVEKNIFIRNLNNIKQFFTDASTGSSNPSNQTYRPIVTLSFAIDHFIAKGLDPFYFHLNMFIIYIFQLVLMFFIIRKIIDMTSSHKWNIYITFFIVFLYGLHTVNAETINYISSRSDSYSTFFVLGGFFIYMYFPRIRKLHLYLIPVIIGILTKEQAVMFAPIFFFYLLIFEFDTDLSQILKKQSFEPLKKSFIKSLPSILVCGLLGLFVLKMQTSTYTPGGTSQFHYLITQPWVYLRYFLAFFFPVNLSADTDWVSFTNIFDERAIVGYVFILALIIIILKMSKEVRTRPVAFGLIWFILALLPTSSIIPLAEVTNDHRMFYPFVGLSLAIISYLRFLLLKFENKITGSTVFKSVIVIFCLLVLSAHAYGVRQRNKVWSSAETLWYDVTIKSPNNGRGLMNYGLTQMEKGNYDLALEYYNKALLITPYYPYLHVNTAILYNAIGNSDKAEEYFQNAIRYGSTIYVTHFHYAKFLFEKKRYNEALYHAEQTLKLSPYLLENRHLLYDIYFNLNKFNELKSLLEETLKLKPDDNYSLIYKGIDFSRDLTKVQLAEQVAFTNPSPENYLNLSLEYYYIEEYEKCIEACYKSLELNPNYAEAYNNICSAYNCLEEWGKACEACEKAIQLKPGYTLAENNLKLAKKNL